MVIYRVMTIAALSATSVLIHPSGGQSLSPAQPAIAPTSLETTAVIISRANRSLPNNTNIIAPNGTSGSGMLTVKNGTNQDAAIKLVDRTSGTTLRFVYVRAKQNATMTGIGPYRCTLKYSTGAGWNSNTQKFSKDVSFYQFKETLDFAKERQRVTYEATLNSVVGGNTIPRTISEKDF